MSDLPKNKTRKTASVPKLSEATSQKGTRKNPCPKGTRFNKKTGNCEPNAKSQVKPIDEPQTLVDEPQTLINEPQTLINEQQTVIQQPVITEQNNIPCLEDLKKLRTEFKEKNKEVVEKNKECEKMLYGNFVQQYFGKIDEKNLTHRLLLKGLFNFYKTEKNKNKDFVLPFGVENEDFNKRGFIQRFPRDNAIPNTNFKRQHIFEALCRLLLLFNYDEGELGNNKTFYTSLEGLLQGNSTVITLDDILDTKVNESSKGGIVDILFKTNISIDTQKQEKMSACEYTAINNDIQVNGESTTILIQNKFFDVEKTNIDKYDVTRIHTLAGKLEVNKSVKNSKIILMVNNQEALSSNLIKSKQQFGHIMPAENIYGVTKIDKWFNKLLYDLYSAESLDVFLEKKKNKIGVKNNKQTMEPRFHQLLITNSTLEYNKVNGTQKFIWGAVPRSGKSFMIGDFISKRKESQNDIVIILGAKTETEPQFKKMFKEWANFMDYAVITPDPDGIDNAIGSRKIYIFSQEYFKSKGKIDLGITVPKNIKKITSEMKRNIRERVKFTTDINSKFPDLLREGKKIDIFFDEIHKGGSTDNSETILYSFINAGLLIDFFIMVTATFAKPTEFYSDLNIGDNTIQLIEWSYSDQQFMKEVTNETKKQEMINSRTNAVERKIMEDLFEDYRLRYGLSYLQVLSSEYTKYPELVLISPQLLIQDQKLFQTNDVRNVFIGNLKCEACIPGQSIANYQMPSNIFKQENPVTELLEYIGDKIYNRFIIDFSYNAIASSHTELWFLPDSDLYQEDCNACKNVSEERNEEEDEFVEEEEDEEDDALVSGVEGAESIAASLVRGVEGAEPIAEPLAEPVNKKNKANIEPLTRGLAIKITKHERFIRYNVFIVHNTPLSTLGKNVTETTLFGQSFNGRIKMYNPLLATANKRGDALSLAEQIRIFERETYNAGRSLIILTGAKLRLGISLPCVDIGFNFDNIKSIDNNYQTMFRVLTEREKPTIKKYGYYVDFNVGRSIEFLYQYATVYGDKQNKKSTQEKIEYLQSLLFSFNFNGLNMTNQSSDISMYNDLKEKLELTNEKYVTYWSKNANMASLIKKGLAASDQNQLKELAQLLKITAVKKPNKLQTVIKKGEKRQELEQIELQKKSPLYIENYKRGETEGYRDPANTGESDGYYSQQRRHRKINSKNITGNDEIDGYNKGLVDGFNKRYDELYAEGVKRKEEEGGDEIYTDDLIDQLAQEIPTIVTLLALFSTEQGRECDSINDCLDNSIKQIEGFAELCRCGTVNKSNIVDCFMNSPGNINGVGLAEPLEEADEEDFEEEAYEGGGAESFYDKGTLIKIFDIIKKQIANSPLINDSLEIKFSTIIQKMKGAKDTLIKTMTPSEIDTFITNNLTIKKTEKDKFGEVFTPPSLIKEMLAKLPSEVWTNPNLKWLDPANGIGNFPMLVYEKLFEKLREKIPNDTERSNHILSKMLYMVEINPKNVKISRKIFGPNANIACADFLNETDKWKKEFKGVDKFDVIIGNPPFNAGQEYETKKGGGDSLWPKFVKDCIKLLVDNGYLVFVHPSAWRKPESEKSKNNGMFEMVAHENQIEYLEIHNTDDGKKTFNAGTRYDWYVLKKTQAREKTTIKDETGKLHSINLQKWYFLPNYNFELIEPILTQTAEHVNVMYSRNQYGTDKPWVCEEEGDRICIKKKRKNEVTKEIKKPLIKQNFIHPLVHSTPKSGPRFHYTSTKTPPVAKLMPMFGVKKVIFGESGINKVVVDFTGKYGMTQESIGIEISSKEEGEKIAQVLESDKFKEVLSALSFGNYRIDWRIFTYFKPDFYKYFLKGSSPPAALTKKKSPVTATSVRTVKRRIRIKEPKQGGGKTKKKPHIKIPRKTRRKN